MKYTVNVAVAFAVVSLFSLGTISDALAATAGCDLNIKLTKKAEMMPGGAHAKGGEGMKMAGMKKDTMPGMKMAGMKKDAMPGMKMTGMKKDAMPGMKMAATKKDTMSAMNMANMKKDAMPAMKMANMKGAHEIHEGQHGGTFFMAPNKTNHVEGIYSKDCGFRLVIFNAMTQPIDVNRFGAFVKFIPEDEDAPESYRILSSSHDGSVLQASNNPEIKGEFDVELYVKFPGGGEPVMFNIRTKH